MRRYFFNLRTDQETLIDDEGIPLASVDRAIDEARRAAREMLAEAVLRDEAVDGTAIDVLDEDHTLITSVALTSMVRI